MTSNSSIPVQMLGQSGCRLSFPQTTVYLDPYLSNSVQELDAPDIVRQIPIPFAPEKVNDANWVLVTHAHIDHCDPHTLPNLAKASPQARFIGPAGVVNILLGWGISADRVYRASEEWQPLGPELRIRAVPAAHPEIERDANGNLSCLGYVIEYAGNCIYLAGDTFAKQEIIDALVSIGPIHTAFLPVNEHNFFRGRRGIIGNMSVREAFQLATEISATQVVAVHWDMFAVNSVDPEEIRFIHQRLKPNFKLLINPSELRFAPTSVSIVLRTLNEEKYLDSLLQSIAKQKVRDLEPEVILVDSGSTDKTLAIAEKHGCKIVHIKRQEFSFGRALNLGCDAASGSILVFISGHCVPTDESWLENLCQPIVDGTAQYSYGRQIAGPESQFSESRIFAKYYLTESSSPQPGFFCNNANAALLKQTWLSLKFDESLTGLEDMELAQRLVGDDGKVAYVAPACVFHYHNETWPQVKRRFEREAIALQKILPSVQIDIFDMLRYIFTSVIKDWQAAAKDKVWQEKAIQILRYRINQYYGSFLGNRQHRILSKSEKDKYFYPE